MNAFQINNRELNSANPRLMRAALLLVTTLLLLATLPASAHKLNMFAYAEGNEIFVEGYFADGKKAKNSAVTVFDASNSELLSGTSDGEGQFSFAIPQQSDMRITINAGMGHQTEYTLLKDELRDDPEVTDSNSAASPITATTGIAAINSGITTQTDEGPLTPTIAANIDPTTLRNEVERAVGKAIKPLMRELSAMRAEKSFADIVGGIGFIFGLLGIAMYFKARKQ